MIHPKKYIWLIAALLLILQARAQEKILLKGYMKDESSFAPVPLANILIKTTGAKAISNRTGFFHFIISKEDSIYITAIGYHTKLIIAGEVIPKNPDDTIRIYLRPIVYKLKTVDVVYSNHKRDSIARLAAEYLKTDPLLNNYDRILKRDRGTLMNPLTAMYEAWSKEGDDMRRFEEFLRYAEQQKEVDKRYNRDVVKRVTELDDSEIDDFMLFCKLDRTFVITSDDYDLYAAIRKCADNFRAQQLRERTKLR